jgi:hypothetical protein
MQQPNQPSNTPPDVGTQAPPSPEFAQLLNAGMGVVVVPDDADFPESSLLVVKQSAAIAVIKVAVELVGQVTVPFLLAVCCV